MQTRIRTRISGGRLVAIAAVLLALVALPAAAHAAKVLKKGARGERVEQVQRALGLRADGIFGPATKRAVKRFQRRRGLTADGIVGPATWAALLRAGDRRTRSRGSRRPAVRSRGDAVRLLQRELGIPADGIFGPATKAAVKRFQRRRGLTADGIVGPATWAALGRRGMTVVLKARGGSRSGSRASGVPRVVRRVIAAANRIARKPYKYGGGHARWDDSGYDCSGSVSYALRGGGLLDSPMASGGFMSYGAPGRGRWITIYAKRSHMFMVVRGRRFDTSGARQRGTRWTSEMRDTSGYVVRHPVGY